MSISDIVGYPFDTLEEAKGHVTPGYLVVTENDEKFYVVTEETFNKKLFQLEYKAV